VRARCSGMRAFVRAFVRACGFGCGFVCARMCDYAGPAELVQSLRMCAGPWGGFQARIELEVRRMVPIEQVVPRRVVSHAAWYPTPHGIPRRMVSLPAHYPPRHGEPSPAGACGAVRTSVLLAVRIPRLMVATHRPPARLRPSRAQPIKPARSVHAAAAAAAAGTEPAGLISRAGSLQRFGTDRCGG
jgi:hypothetical protein